MFWNNDYSRGLAGHMRPATSVVRPASAPCCWLCHLSSDGLVESEQHRSQKIYRSSEENRSKWVLFRIAIYRSSGYNPIFCPAGSVELPDVLISWCFEIPRLPLRESIPRLLNEGSTAMTACCAPACSQALPVKPQGVWASGIEAWARSRDRRNWRCGGGGLRGPPA